MTLKLTKIQNLKHLHWTHVSKIPLVLGLFALLAALWAGVIRLGWDLPILRPALPMSHGPLMISGFLGTVIGVERAVALSVLPNIGSNLRWTYAGPLLTGLGAVSLIIWGAGSIGPFLMTLGSLNLVLVFVLILRMQPALFTITMAAGALLWLVGNGLWLLDWPIHIVVFWWSGFLILTIAGERLELSRVLRLPRAVQILFVAASGLFLVGLVLSSIEGLVLSSVEGPVLSSVEGPVLSSIEGSVLSSVEGLVLSSVEGLAAWPVNVDAGARLAGGGMIALALWLLRYDIARRTVRKSGLTRFIAVCLLTGYGWLAVGGGLGVLFGGVTAGFRYDAVLHTVFIGFVISMIFGHAPIIFPAVMGKPVPFQPVFYAHLTLLHISLLLRVGGDLTAWLPGRQWGGLLNAAALLLFLVNTVRAVRSSAASSTASKVTLQAAD